MFNRIKQILGAKAEPVAPRKEPKIEKRNANFSLGVPGRPHAFGFGEAVNELTDLFPEVNANGGLTNAARTKFSLFYLRNASRLIMREQAYAARYMDMTVQNVLKRKPEMPRFDADLDDDLGNEIGKAWCKWWGSEQVFIDSLRCGAEIERDLLASVIQDGDILVEFVIQNRELKLRQYKSDDFFEFAAGHEQKNSHNQYMGVVYNNDGKPTSYLVREKNNETNISLLAPQSGKAKEISSDQCVHVFDPRSAKEWRGYPWITPVITRLAAVKSFDTFTSSSLRMLSKISGFITKTPDSSFNNYGSIPGARQDVFEDNDDADAPRLKDDLDRPRADPDAPGRVELGANSVWTLGPGEDLKTLAANIPSGMTQNYRSELIHEIWAGLGIDYATAMGDFSATNFAGARQGVLNNRDNWKDLQAWWHVSFRRHVFKKWVMFYEGVLFRRLNSVEREMVMDVEWIGPRWAWVDPMKDAVANIKALDAGLISPQEIAQQRGVSINKILSDIAEARKQAEELDLDLYGQTAKDDNADADMMMDDQPLGDGYNAKY